MELKETTLAADIKNWLVQNGWTVYQEVKFGNNRADLVAVSDPIVWIIECKTSFSLKVLEQAEHWTRYAHLVSVAVPMKKRKWGSYSAHRRDFEEIVCKKFGVGLITADYRNGKLIIPDIKDALRPKVNRKTLVKKFRASLVEEQKTLGEAGSCNSDYYTPFRNTLFWLKKYVEKNPGCILGDAIKNIKHHYHSDYSAISCMMKYMKKGIITDIELRREGKKFFLYIKE